MSDYIYGSSLRAAKSKANYLFEGDFRRRPSQNLSGASRSLARGELLQQAAEERQNREDVRKKNQASIKIQSIWRGFLCRRHLAASMRGAFDVTMKHLSDSQNIQQYQFEALTREFAIYYHSIVDEIRIAALVDLILKHHDTIVQFKEIDSKAWLFKMTKLLKMNLGLLERYDSSSNLKCLQLMERFTRVTEVIDDSEAATIWSGLIKQNIFSTFRRLLASNKRINLDNKLSDNSNVLDEVLIELIRRSLDLNDSNCTSVQAFFREFLHGPLDTSFEEFYLTELVRMKPRGLQPNQILSSFKNLQATTSSHSGYGQFKLPTSYSKEDLIHIDECNSSIWLCYSFVRTMYTQIDQLSDFDKGCYVNILSNLISPAIYITNLSLMQAANNQDCNQTDEEPEEYETSIGTNHIGQYHTETNRVITRIVNIINNLSHIKALKSIIFDKKLQPLIQAGIIRICNLMLAHEPLAIFNCRLLYTIAFSREFSRSLWKSINSATGTTIYGMNTPECNQITQGRIISLESWETILPQLRLFCSLFSYLLPTLDDEEFYTDDDKSTLLDISIGALKHRSEVNLPPSNKNQADESFFIDKELVSIITVLRDFCVGFIEVLYQDRHAYSQLRLKYEQELDKSEGKKLLSFEMKTCFKALVRLVCQLQARDSRKQFCPDGHWICPSVIIPADKAVDFQLVTSQQGRLLSHMIKENVGIERTSITSSEIKTVLILQEIPFVISFHDRVQIFHQLLRKEKQLHHTEGYHFGLPGTAIQVQIRRSYIYEDSFEKLSFENEPNMKLPLKVSLINAAGVSEAGIDGGGLTKEFLSELLKAGFDPMRGFFKSTTDQLLYPNPSANIIFSTLPEGYEIHYEFLGRILGKAIFEKIMVELPLASFFLAKLLARRHSSEVDLHNLASLDPVLYKNLVYLKNYKGDVADLNLDFTISNNELDEHEVVELKPGGSKIPVTRENKIEYVHLVADYRLNKQIRAQCAAFKRGLTQLIDLDWLRMFDSRELQILISGTPTVIDIEDWRRHTIYANGYSDTSVAIDNFWRVTSQFDEQQKRKLLKFATSCSLPPLLGFKDLVPQFTIAPTEEQRLPSSSTCMNLLKLPDCTDESTMRSKLLYAIESNSGFELS